MGVCLGTDGVVGVGRLREGSMDASMSWQLNMIEKGLQSEGGS